MAQHGVVPTASEAAPPTAGARRRAGPRLSPVTLRVVLFALVVVAVVAAVVVVVTLRLLNQDPEPPDENWWLVGELVVGFAYLAAGAVLTAPREHRVRGVALLAVGMVALVAAVALAVRGLRPHGSEPAGVAVVRRHWPRGCGRWPWRSSPVWCSSCCCPAGAAAQPWVRGLLVVAGGLRRAARPRRDHRPRGRRGCRRPTRWRRPARCGREAIDAAGQLARVGIVAGRRRRHRAARPPVARAATEQRRPAAGLAAGRGGGRGAGRGAGAVGWRSPTPCRRRRSWRRSC